MVRTIRGPYLITTSPSMTTCSMCHRPVLAATIGGLDRHVDLAALNDHGELVALLSGCQTYELHGDELVPRSPGMIAKATASPVLASHRHGIEVPADQIDVAVSARAVVLIVTALGGVVVGKSDRDATPPF
jgi:hypothetical protein